MPAQQIVRSLNPISLNSYDPLIWRKDVHALVSIPTNNNLLISGNVETDNPEKIVKSIFNDSGMFVK